jgi:hypothetical protein
MYPTEISRILSKFYERCAINTYNVQSFGTLKLTTSTASINYTDDCQLSSEKRNILRTKVFEIKEIRVILVSYGSNCNGEIILVGKSCGKRAFLRDMGTDVKVMMPVIMKRFHFIKDKVRWQNFKVTNILICFEQGIYTCSRNYGTSLFLRVLSDAVSSSSYIWSIVRMISESSIAKDVEGNGSSHV